MPIFERTQKLSIVMLVLGSLLLVLTVVLYFTSHSDEIFLYNFTNDLRGMVLTIVSFVLSAICLILGWVLRAVALDAKETIQLLESRNSTSGEEKYQ